MKKNILLIFSSLFITLLFIEIFLQKFYYKENFTFDYKKKFILYEQGNVFRNIDNNFFTYHPNSNIRTSLYYYDEKLIKVYDYNIITNNLGLVQKNNIKENHPSILILGDSFTEGQGSSSWIDNFQGHFKSFQVINGGILGTGPQQFLSLENYLSSKANIKYVFVLYVGDDFRRSIFTHNDQAINCLKSYKLCNGSEIFYGFPLNTLNPSVFLQDMKKEREQSEIKITFKKIRRNFKKKITELYIYKIPNSFLKNNFYKSKNKKIMTNFKAIEDLINKYQDKIYFVNLKQKQEILFKKESYETIYAHKFIKSKTKNNFNCNFDNNLNNFYIYDAHLNKKGYKNLYSCILNIFNSLNLN